ncbi:MAG: hypothetical protein JNM30_02355 [Rhodospirillales bacterium]|nr:hypothetical protein [Rhodospirillales bacterium]
MTKVTHTLAALALVAGLAGTAGINHAQAQDSTLLGAGAGAGAGAGIGFALGGPVGAVVGGLVGAGVGAGSGHAIGDEDDKRKEAYRAQQRQGYQHDPYRPAPRPQN